MFTVLVGNLSNRWIYSRSLVFVGHGQTLHLTGSAIRRQLWDGNMVICVAVNDSYNLNVAASITQIKTNQCEYLWLLHRDLTDSLYWQITEQKDEMKLVMQWDMIEETGINKNRLEPNSKQFICTNFTQKKVNLNILLQSQLLLIWQVFFFMLTFLHWVTFANLVCNFSFSHINAFQLSLICKTSDI